MSAHAILSASGSHRWLTCTPSAMLEQEFPDSTSSYADEGLLAHALADLGLKLHLNRIDIKDFNKRRKELESSPYYSREMVDYVDDYIAVVIEKICEAYNRSKDAVVMLEQRLDFSRWVPGGFGTGDVVIVSDDLLEVVDLKYGKGVPVSAEDNPQMMLYALGALAKFDYLYDIRNIRMTICQPRLDSISTAEMSVDELMAWAEDYLQPRAQMAIAGEGDFIAGDHCQFCRAKATCRARAEANLELAKMDFQKPPLLSLEEIAEVLTKAEQLQSWASDVQAYALDQAQNHDVKFPGWKLVSGRSNRKYANEKAVSKTLIDAGYEEAKIYQPKEILGITAMEKEIGKKRFGELLNGLIVKPAGKPTLVPESDKRPEINSTDAAKADFK